MSRKSGVIASDWAVVESKTGPPSTAKMSRISIPQGTGKNGRKKKDVVIHIPRSFIPEVKRMFNAAFWDAETLDDPVVGFSTFGFFSQVTQGNGAQNRQGDYIFVNKLVIRIQLIGSVSAPSHTAVLALNLDKEPAVVESIASPPSWSDYYQGIGGAGLAAYTVPIPNYDKRARFGYLKHITEPMTPMSVSPGGSVFYQEKYITIEHTFNRKIRYDSTMGTPYAGCEAFLIGWSNLAANVPKAEASYELFFTDV